MNLADYLTQHDGKPSPSGAECIRLAAAVSTSPMYLYLSALGHKRFSPEKALDLHRNSIGGELSPDAIRDDYDWHRDSGGRFVAWAPKPATAA